MGTITLSLSACRRDLRLATRRCMATCCQNHAMDMRARYMMRLRGARNVTFPMPARNFTR
eukprot:577896-Pyramimonas_sp.AAC.1